MCPPFFVDVSPYNFYNEGFGWFCKQCEQELASGSLSERSRLMTEGEAESKTPDLSNRALAKWADAAQTTLICPHCGITEVIDTR